MRFKNVHSGTVFVVTRVKANPARGMDFYYGHYEDEEPDQDSEQTMYTEHELNRHWKQI